MSVPPEQPAGTLHDLRNVLNAIGSCAYLLEHEDDVERMRELASRVREKSREAAELVDSIRARKSAERGD